MHGNHAAGAGTEWRALGAARGLRVAGRPLRHLRLGPSGDRPTLQRRARKLPQCRAADNAAPVVAPGSRPGVPLRAMCGGREARMAAVWPQHPICRFRCHGSRLPEASRPDNHAPRADRVACRLGAESEGQELGKPRPPWSRCLQVRRCRAYNRYGLFCQGGLAATVKRQPLVKAHTPTHPELVEGKGRVGEWRVWIVVNYR